MHTHTHKHTHTQTHCMARFEFRNRNGLRELHAKQECFPLQKNIMKPYFQAHINHKRDTIQDLLFKDAENRANRSIGDETASKKVNFHARAHTPTCARACAFPQWTFFDAFSSPWLRLAHTHTHTHTHTQTHTHTAADTIRESCMPVRSPSEKNNWSIQTSNKGNGFNICFVLPCRDFYCS